MVKKSLLLSGLIVGLGCSNLKAQPLAIYENFGTIDVSSELPIDAEAFANYGSFDVFSILPFSTLNTLNFTNRGLMRGTVGFDFRHVAPDGRRGPAETFVNEGGSEIIVGSLIEDDPAFLLIEAERIINNGSVRVGPGGLVRMTGDDVSLFNAGLEVRPIRGNGGFQGNTNFASDTGILGLYWGGITNEIVETSTILGLAGNTITVISPEHAVTNSQFFTTLEQLSLQSPFSFVQSNALTDTNIVVQTIFVSVPGGFNADARFADGVVSNELNTLMVEVSTTMTNAVSGNIDEFSLFLTDTLAGSTNHLMLPDTATATFRPATYELSRIQPAQWENGLMTNPAIPITPELLWNSTYSNTMVTNIYAAYSALANSLVTLPLSLEEADVEELPGRIEINAKNLDLGRTRVRGEGLITIQTDHLENSLGAVIDVQNLNLNLASTNGVLTVQDVARPQVARLGGILSAYSMAWTNQSGIVTEGDPMADPNTGEETPTMITNVVDIFNQVFIVDARQLTRRIPVFTHDFVTDSEMVRVMDDMDILRRFETTASVLENDANLQLLDPPTRNIHAENIPNLKRFVNRGSFTVGEVADFGFGAEEPIDSFANHGTFIAFSPRIVSHEFENLGDLTAGGSILLNSTSMSFGGGNTSAGRDITLAGENLKLRDASIEAGLKLFVNVSDTLVDSGPDAGNVIRVSGGVEMLTRPAAGSLLGTEIESNLRRFAFVDHTWAAEDRGATADGFTDNSAIGRFTINAPVGSQAQFSAAGGAGAIYIDFLNLGGDLEANWRNALIISEGMTVYFADSNVPVEDLDGAFDDIENSGRLVWVRDFRGPNSSVEVVDPDTGQTVLVNRGLRQSRIIDSDGDGTANGFDPTPFGGPTLTDLAVDADGDVLRTTMSWFAAANTTYNVEFQSTVGNQDWQTLKTIRNDDNRRRMITVSDEVAVDNPARFYRVTYQPR